MFEKNKMPKLAKYQIRAPVAGVGLMRGVRMPANEQIN